MGREREEAPFLLFSPIRSSTCWETSATGNYRKLNASAVGAGTGETSVVSQDDEEKLRENLPFPVKFSNSFHAIVLIREALIGDNYLPTHTCGCKGQKSVPITRNNAHFFPLMLTTTIQQNGVIAQNTGSVCLAAINAGTEGV